MTQPDKPIDTVKVFREAVSYVTPDPADLSKFLRATYDTPRSGL